jgi:hypothetical protein
MNAELDIAKLRQQAIKQAETAWLRAREKALQALTGQALIDAEDELCEIQEELEYRLTHIVVGEQIIEVKLQWVSQQCCAWRADGEQPNRIGFGADEWKARNELEEILEDWGCSEALS